MKSITLLLSAFLLAFSISLPSARAEDRDRVVIVMYDQATREWSLKTQSRYLPLPIFSTPDQSHELSMLLQGRLNRISPRPKAVIWDQRFIEPDFESKAIVDLAQAMNQASYPLVLGTRSPEDGRLDPGIYREGNNRFRGHMATYLSSDGVRFNPLQLDPKQEGLLDADSLPVAGIAALLCVKHRLPREQCIAHARRLALANASLRPITSAGEREIHGMRPVMQKLDEVSMKDVLEGDKHALRKLKGAVVVIGNSFDDVGVTAPERNSDPLVYVHAWTLQNLLDLTTSWSPLTMSDLPVNALEAWKTDGCTGFPNGIWRNCCVIHDVDCWMGGTVGDRMRAAGEIFQCVSKVATPVVASLMLAGVVVGGVENIDSTFRWGSGWAFNRGTAPRSPLEQQQVDELKARLKRENYKERPGETGRGRLSRAYPTITGDYCLDEVLGRMKEVPKGKLHFTKQVLNHGAPQIRLTTPLCKGQLIATFSGPGLHICREPVLSERPTRYLTHLAVDGECANLFDPL